jgi:hypothetical protein
MAAKKCLSIVVCFGCSLAMGLSSDGAKKQKAARAAEAAASDPAVMWQDPGDIASRDLFDGPGGPEHTPHGVVRFEKEDMDGTNPKFVVKDKDGVKWKVKLGIEARPETVASRFLWAVGYYANEDYFVSDLHVEGMPAHLHRGQNMVAPDGSVPNVRLKREDEKKLGTWSWRDDPFSGTREINGLRTLMAVLNNWDLKDENNAIYAIGGKRVFTISDIGASFGCPDRCIPKDKSKGNLDEYGRSQFIRKVTPDTVSFETPAAPAVPYVFSMKEYVTRVRLEWIGRDIPRVDARWMGSLLARLSPQQIQDAFRAAGYSPEEIDGFSKILAGRIKELTDL